MSQHILFEFCLRLAAGLSCIVVFTLGRGIGPPFFRTLMSVILGLSVLAWLNGPDDSPVLSILLSLCGIFSSFGFVFWTLGRVRMGAGAALLLFGCSAACLIFWARHRASDWIELALVLGTGLSSALLLGSVVAAMLLGHTYLIAPTMSIDPLRLLVWWIASSVLLRSILAGTSLVLAAGRVDAGLSWPSWQPFWWWMLTARVLIGLVGPAIIAWMVWQTARIRSTQSATGILYAGVVLVFFGELLGQLLGA